MQEFIEKHIDFRLGKMLNAKTHSRVLASKLHHDRSTVGNRAW